jgi:hypothetical protein
MLHSVSSPAGGSKGAPLVRISRTGRPIDRRAIGTGSPKHDALQPGGSHLTEWLIDWVPLTSTDGAASRDLFNLIAPARLASWVAHDRRLVIGSAGRGGPSS